MYLLQVLFFCHLHFGGFTEMYCEKTKKVVQGPVIVRETLGFKVTCLYAFHMLLVCRYY